MKFTIISVGRFPLYRVAEFLSDKELLQLFITNYPKIYFRAQNFNKKIISKPSNGIFSWFVYKYLPKRQFPNFFNRIVKFIHVNFGKFASRKKSSDNKILLVQSSFARELLSTKKVDQIVIIDHGSLHLKDDELYASMATQKSEPKINSNLPWSWIIERENYEFSNADWIIVPSTISRDSLIRNGVNEKKIVINPYGVDLLQFYPIRRCDQIFRIIQVGQISERKGVLLSLRAFKNLNIENAEIIFIGSKQYQKEKVEHLLKDIHNTVKIIPSINERSLVNYYGIADVLIMPSYADGFGLVVLQAMACGLPVIVSDMVGAADIVSHGIDGYIFKSGDQLQLEKYINKLHKNPEERKLMGKMALLKIKKNYTWDSYLKRYLKILINIDKNHKH